MRFIVRKGSNFFKQRHQSGIKLVVPTSKKQRTEAVLLVVRRLMLNAHGKSPNQDVPPVVQNSFG